MEHKGEVGNNFFVQTPEAHRFLSYSTPKTPAGGSGLSAGGNGSRGALPLRRALDGAAGQSSSPWAWARCWVRCWACRAGISSPAPAFSRCSHLLQPNGSGSPRTEEPDDPDENENASMLPAGAWISEIYACYGIRCARLRGIRLHECEVRLGERSPAASAHHAPRSSQHVDLLK